MDTRERFEAIRDLDITAEIAKAFDEVCLEVGKLEPDSCEVVAAVLVAAIRAKVRVLIPILDN